jgi:hypothetical protein
MELVQYAAGILVNLLNSKRNSELFLDLEGTEKLAEVLEIALQNQQESILQLAAKAIHNLK